MNKRSLGGLIALNVALLVALVVVQFTPTVAQGQPRVRPGDYIMVSGNTVGRNSQAVIYIVELKSSKVLACFYNSSDDSFTTIDGRIMNDDIAGAGHAR